MNTIKSTATIRDTVSVILFYRGLCDYFSVPFCNVVGLYIFSFVLNRVFALERGGINVRFIFRV